MGVISRPYFETLLIPSNRRHPKFLMTTARFSELHDISELARAVGVPAEQIRSYAGASDQALSYTRLKIPKRGRKRRGQFRVVYKANQEWLSQFHRMVAIIVVKSAPFDDHVQGFVQGRSIRTNAQFHLGARFVLHADISNFFDSITTTQARQSLISIGAREEIAQVVARACTIDGYLRQGTRCSPALANIVCSHLDLDLIRLGRLHGSRYTRYADDLTFSGEDTPTSESVAAVLNQHGFKLRDGRCYTQRRGRGQFVTGLHVGNNDQPRLPRRLKRRLRLVLHYVEKFGIEAHFKREAGNDFELEGMLRFAHSIEPVLANKLLAQLATGRTRESQMDDPDYMHDAPEY